MKTVRLFALLDQLRLAKTPVSAEKLAQDLGVSPRTIYRDVASLQAIGAPIRGESGLGYQLEKGYFLPPLRFDPDELEAIILGLRLVMARDGDSLHGAAERVLGKVATVIGDDDREKFLNLPLLAVTRQRDSDDLAAQWGLMLRRAIRGCQVLELGYLSLEGTETYRRVYPLGLTVFDEAWLLTAWCEWRQDFRNFRLDRIVKITALDEKFRPQIGQRFKDYLAKLVIH